MDLTGIGSIASLAKGVMDKFWPPEADPNKKIEVQLEIQRMMETRESAVVEAQKSIIVSEMSQGDNFTKRARPTIVYAGLAFIFLVHVILPMIAFFKETPIPTVSLPEQFWWAWGGVCSIWVIGRSAEKRGTSGSMISAITGSK